MFVALWDVAMLRLLVPFYIPWQFAPGRLLGEAGAAIGSIASGIRAGRIFSIEGNANALEAARSTVNPTLEMTVEEGLQFFDAMPKIKRKLQTLYDVGLGYVKIGQPATTLSGGEAQRVKLATELSRRPTGKTIYILDEPTTGLHTADVHRLVNILHQLSDAGNSIIVIEHNLDVIKCADYIIDLGPEGGDGGGTVVASGTPEEVAKTKGSYTGMYLKKYLTEK